ncbi:MAG: hypothetical protein C0524_17605 [Rhodobacter sp.]|nr:hypothetical protein [Rhodobacter sp.]
MGARQGDAILNKGGIAMINKIGLLGFWTFSTVISGAAVHAQDASYGAEIYNARCAVCHGDVGAGDGMVGVLFAQPPADLRLIARNNNGEFPTEQVIEAIYGRRPIQAHGQTEMPVRGDFFMSEALEIRTIDPEDAAMVTQGRVLSVVRFLETLQAEQGLPPDSQRDQLIRQMARSGQGIGTSAPQKSKMSLRKLSLRFLLWPWR